MADRAHVGPQPLEQRHCLEELEGMRILDQFLAKEGVHPILGLFRI
jgi:hypothetical protein